MKKVLQCSIILMGFMSFIKGQDAIIDKIEKPVDWVLLLVGTDFDHSLSYGYTRNR